MADRSCIEAVEEQAALFALGDLPPGETASFEQRLAAGCPLCRAETRACEKAVSGLPFAAPEVAPPPDLRARLLDRIRPNEKSRGYSPIGAGRLVRPGDTAWENGSVPGMHIRRLHEGRTILLRMAAQTVYPAHSHKTDEQCLVLEGSITSGGITAYAGDFIYMPAGSAHEPLYTESGCQLLIAYT